MNTSKPNTRPLIVFLSALAVFLICAAVFSPADTAPVVETISAEKAAMKTTPKPARILVSTCAALLCIGAMSPRAGVIAGGRQAGGAPGVSYLVQQDFEGAGYDNGETWTESGTGTRDEDYATSPAPLVGSQSLRVAVSSQGGTTTKAFASDQSTVEGYLQVHFVSLPASGKVFVAFRDSGGTRLVNIEVGASSRITVRCGTGAATTTDAISTGTTYHFWWRYVKGTGANAQASVAFSTDGTRPPSGNKFAAVTNGSRTTDANNIIIGPENNSTWEGIFDKVRVSASTIGDNPS
jgi:hypothetical protein